MLHNIYKSYSEIVVLASSPKSSYSWLRSCRPAPRQMSHVSSDPKNPSI